jgi:polyhydroxyalkanoate synthesis regulator phasin
MTLCDYLGTLGQSELNAVINAATYRKQRGVSKVDIDLMVRKLNNLEAQVSELTSEVAELRKQVEDLTKEPTSLFDDASREVTPK